MRKGQTWLIGLVAFMTIASLWYLSATLKLWTMPLTERDKLAQADPTKLFSLEKRAIKLGLDLKGGMYVVLEVDKSKLKPEEAEDAQERALEIIRNRVDQFGVTEPIIHKAGTDRIIVELPGLQDVERAKQLIGRTAQLEFKLLAEPELIKQLFAQIDVSSAQTQPEKQGTLAEKSKSETKPKTQEDKSLTELFTGPKTDTGAKPDTAQASEPDQELSSRPFTALLEPVSQEGYSYRVEEEDVPKVKQILEKPEVKALIPEDVELAWSTRTVTDRGITYMFLYVVRKPVELSGKYLTDATPSYDQFRRPIVNFQLTKEGGRLFAALTGANIGKPLAIVLDGTVESAPVIQSKIRDRGQIELGNAKFEEAQDLAVVLRAGALPAPVKIVESRVIGPSLGQDSIQKGLLSSVIGALAVILFMAIYYKLSGTIADFALLLNVLFLMAVLAVFHATLTLPGIAGIILTMGMSVDSNVLIFERIREELRTGKTIRASIDAGYKRALLTIIDSHITTLITAFALFLFGTGPIKGFAVTLSAGVIISLFTALLVTKMIFDIRKQYQSLSI